MTKEDLERIVSGRPSSPLFARLAALYLAEGDHGHALALCEPGLRTHPDYPSGLLIAAKACTAAGDPVRAAGLARQLSALLPGNAIVAELPELSRPVTVQGSAHQNIHPSMVFAGRIVSKTLAEIYASQGAVGEAIETYRLLAYQRPSDREEIEARIKELSGEGGE